MQARFLLPAFAALLLAASCSSAGATSTSLDPPSPSADADQPAEEPPPGLDPDEIVAGADLYSRFCASCHGADLAGHPNWKEPNQDGSYPPPPQDSSGHTWHHGDDLLIEIILEGSDFPQSRMPAFGDRLAEAEVGSILEFFKSSWGAQEREFQWEVTVQERARS